MIAESAAAPNNILPEPRLAFVDAGRDALAQWRAIERDAYALLVHRMAGLVQCRKQCVTKIVLVDAGGDAHVAGRKARAERMKRKVKPTAVKVVARR